MANIITTTVSPVLAALFVAEDAARIVAETRQCDDNDNARCLIQYEIAHHTAETVNDLKTKLGFMVEQKMGDGMDWLPTVLEDVQRIEPVETADRVEALKRYEETTAENTAALAAFSVAEATFEEDPHVEATRAHTRANMRLDEASNAQCEAIRALILPPAPSLSALLVNMQIAIDTGMIACTDLNNALATDLRRFSNYANQEA
ncbi:hypothetical protein QP179_14360 [Sphingomonas aurantiaca]|uniref:hypothetical protein n=1 Tax=Sphingomonas aurantiaca TaxID=185949 RepID=UPI002FE1E1C2